MKAWVIGSRMYNCHNEESGKKENKLNKKKKKNNKKKKKDFDILAVVKDEIQKPDFSQSISLDYMDLNVYEVDFFERLVNENVLQAVLCIFADHCEIKPKKQEKPFEFKFNLRKIDLRR